MNLVDVFQVLVGLRYLAKGDFLSEVAELHGISRTSAFSIINNFVEAVNHRLDNIRFPTGDELDRVRVGFYRRRGIPNTVGALDGSLIPIVAPSQNEEVYVCRKNFHAINIQAVVDHECRFTNLVARWPGSTHDASIFENCGLKRHLDGGNVGHLLGDAGYALKRILITPVLRPATEAEKRFNNSHSSGRMVVERTFGLLKSRFRCLHKTGGCLYMRPDKCCRVIEACVRLHNYCLTRQIPMPDEPDNVGNDEEQIGQPIAADLGAVEYRNQLINLFQ